MEQWETFGNVSLVSAISDFTWEPRGAARDLDAEHLRNALGVIQVDEWADGREERHTLDGMAIRIRRDGWRIQVWPDGEPQPEVDPLPPPVELATRKRLPRRIRPMVGYIEEPAPPKPVPFIAFGAAVRMPPDAVTEAIERVRNTLSPRLGEEFSMPAPGPKGFLRARRVRHPVADPFFVVWGDGEPQPPEVFPSAEEVQQVQQSAEDELAATQQFLRAYRSAVAWRNTLKAIALRYFRIF